MSYGIIIHFKGVKYLNPARNIWVRAQLVVQKLLGQSEVEHLFLSTYIYDLNKNLQKLQLTSYFLYRLITNFLEKRFYFIFKIKLA